LPTRDIMAQQQRLLGEFGDFGLRTDDLDAILNTACRLVAAEHWRINRLSICF